MAFSGAPRDVKRVSIASQTPDSISVRTLRGHWKATIRSGEPKRGRRRSSSRKRSSEDRTRSTTRIIGCSPADVRVSTSKRRSNSWNITTKTSDVLTTCNTSVRSTPKSSCTLTILEAWDGGGKRGCSDELQVGEVSAIEVLVSREQPVCLLECMRAHEEVWQYALSHRNRRLAAVAASLGFCTTGCTDEASGTCSRVVHPSPPSAEQSAC